MDISSYKWERDNIWTYFQRKGITNVTQIVQILPTLSLIAAANSNGHSYLIGSELTMHPNYVATVASQIAQIVTREKFTKTTVNSTGSFQGLIRSTGAVGNNIYLKDVYVERTGILSYIGQLKTIDSELLEYKAKIKELSTRRVGMCKVVEYVKSQPEETIEELSLAEIKKNILTEMMQDPDVSKEALVEEMYNLDQLLTNA